MARPDFGEWRVAEGHELDGGGQGDVFVVGRTDDPKLCVLKRLKNPKRRPRFEREVATMRELAAAGVPVPPVIDEGEDRGRPWFVMPFYERGSLESALDDRRYIDDPVAGVEMLLAISAALAAMHACGKAHRDLKPENVLVAEDRKPLLADFGLALSIDEQKDEPRVTESTEAVGSRWYIAPENETGFNPEFDQSPADFYAFAKMG